MTKPAGPLCNLDCRYCFYLEKQNLFPKGHSFRMTDEVLEHYVRGYIESQPTEEVQFAWQGGEPTLLGVEFFEKVVALQQQYGGGRQIFNALQTNGTLLDDRWGAFLRRHRFLVGVSIDGPRRLHDKYRVDKGGGPSFDRVVDGIELLKRHGVEFNTLTVVNRRNARHPLEVYRFLKEIGSGYIQFIPIVERSQISCGKTLAGPPQTEAEGTVTSWSVRPLDYGKFLSAVFREWVGKDVGRVYVQMFDVTLGAWVGAPPALCIFAPRCGNALAMESNGDVFSCDHYVYPEFHLGNCLERDFAEMVTCDKQVDFGKDKSDTLPAYCRRCRYRFACHGGCPKHRFLSTPDGEPGLNYLCAGYREFFRSSEKEMKLMAGLLRVGRAPAEIMNR